MPPVLESKAGKVLRWQPCLPSSPLRAGCQVAQLRTSEAADGDQLASSHLVSSCRSAQALEIYMSAKASAQAAASSKSATEHSSALAKCK
eukprot:scaffold8767_cov121-Isochrysis_galbana.AAC.2